MKINKPYGSKERLFEMMNGVNKGLLKEDFDYHAAEMDHLGQEDLNNHQERINKINANPQKKFELELATKMFNDLNSENTYRVEHFSDKGIHLDRIAISRMMKDGLLDHDTEETGDFYWFNDRGRAEIKSPMELMDNYFYLETGSNDSESPYLRGYESSS